MKKLGLLLLVIGTVVGSLGGAKLPSASWPISAAGLAILVAAVIALRWRGSTPGEAARIESDGDVASLLARLPERIAELSAKAPKLELSALTLELDAIEAELLAPIAERSSALLPVLGASRFADVFAAFAGTERSLARAWSAAADGHRPEAESSIQRALERSRASAAAIEPTMAPTSGHRDS
jgi:hypothetical protein